MLVLGRKDSGAKQIRMEIPSIQVYSQRTFNLFCKKCVQCAAEMHLQERISW